jgi:signal peptidase I
VFFHDIFIILKLFFSDKKYFYFAFVVALAAVPASVFFFSENIPDEAPPGDCSYLAKKETVRGNSLSGLIENGAEIFLHYGYFDCKEIKKGDVVAYSYAGNEVPLAKIVKGVPGDRFAFKENNGKWNLLINGEPAKNSKGEEYGFGESARKMLSLYEKDYGGTIPSGAYLLLGNLTEGTLDSTHFGLVSGNDILGAILPY